MQNHLVNEIPREGSTVPRALSFFSGVKSGQPGSFRPGLHPWLGAPSSVAVRVTSTARGSWRGRSRPLARAVPGAALSAVNVLGSLRIDGNFLGGRVCSRFPKETHPLGRGDSQAVLLHVEAARHAHFLDEVEVLPVLRLGALPPAVLPREVEEATGEKEEAAAVGGPSGGPTPPRFPASQRGLGRKPRGNRVSG